MEVLTELTPDSSLQMAPTLEPCEVEDGLRLALDAGCNQRYPPPCAGLYKTGRTSVPSNMLILRDSIVLKDSIASRGVISPTVAAVAFAKLVTMSGIGLSSATL